MTAKTIDTIVEDIYGLFDSPVELDEELLTDFSQRITNLIKTRLTEDREHTEPALRLSQIGKPDRKLWYDMQSNHVEDIDGQTRIKFLFGDIVEELLLLFMKAAGHTVEDEQLEVEIDGVQGHQDCKVDGVVVDIKTASKFGMKKFTDGSILNGNDPFGYLPQISSYSKSQGLQEGALLVFNKESGELYLLKVDSIDMINPHERVKHVKEVVALDTPPDRCYEDEAVGASGNRTLCTDCSWCNHKFKCWGDSNDGQGLRGFKYARGVQWLTHVAKTPNVEEVFVTEKDG